MSIPPARAAAMGEMEVMFGGGGSGGSPPPFPGGKFGSCGSDCCIGISLLLLRSRAKVSGQGRRCENLLWTSSGSFLKKSSQVGQREMRSLWRERVKAKVKIIGCQSLFV